ncbi:MAG: helix-turn-helix transcriptional regulator [Alphaproteobacteria bacterium]|nr:MAG: helix-turn-helix transcriptional regulator [Alphaproteobacteria bacterium]
MQTRVKPNTFFTMAQEALEQQGIQVIENKSPIASADAHNVAKFRRRKRWQTRNPLRDLRVNKAYTLEELALATGLSPSYLSRLESGSRRLNADIIQKLSTILECAPADLLPFANGPTSAQNVFPATGNAQHLPVKTAGNQNTPVVDLPLYEMSDEKGVMGFDFSKPKDWIMRGAEFVGVAGAFALRLNTNTFGPRYTQHDLLLAHPSKPLVSQCYVIVVSQENQVFLGQFDHWRAAVTVTGSLGPVGASADDILHIKDFHDSTKTHEFIRKNLKGVYRIVGTAETI